jgi:hypothetical protein
MALAHQEGSWLKYSWRFSESKMRSPFLDGEQPSFADYGLS